MMSLSSSVSIHIMFVFYSFVLVSCCFTSKKRSPDFVRCRLVVGRCVPGVLVCWCVILDGDFVQYTRYTKSKNYNIV